MSAELDLLNAESAAASKYGPDDANLETYTKSFSFHPRLKLYTAQANAVKRKQFPENHYGMIVNKETTIDLGETFVALPLCYRYKALDFTEKGKVKSYYDPESPEFLECKRQADIKRPPGEMSPCMAGIEYLMSVNLEGGAKLATLLCSSASLKGVAKRLFGFVSPSRKFVLFGSHLVDGKFVYQCPNVALYTGSFDYGDMGLLKKEMKAFTDSSGAAVDEDPGEDDPAPPASPPEGDRVR